MEDPDDAPVERSIADYALVVWRRRRIVVAVLVLVLAITAFLTVRTPDSYSSSAKIRLTAARALSSGDVDDTELETELEALKSTTLRNRVRAGMGDDYDAVGKVSFSLIKDTRVLKVSATSASRTVARDAASTYASEYIKQRSDSANQLVGELDTELQPLISDRSDQIADLDAQILREAARGGDGATAVASLQQRRTELSDERATLSQTLNETRLQATLRRGGAEILSAAATPTEPSAPRPVQNILLGMILGMILGVAAALARESVVDVIEDADEMNRALAPISVLGSLPSAPALREEALPVAFTDPTSLASEAMRSIRTSLDFIALEKQLHVVLVTSAAKGEGKSTVASNLAGAITIAGAHVIVVSADLRNPELDARFGLLGRPGLTNVMLGERPLAGVLKDFTPPGHPGRLQVLPVGSIPPNPSELLASDRFNAVVHELRTLCDLVILDSSPILAVTDARLLARHASVIVLVTRLRVSRRRHIREARRLLEAVGGPLVTAVVNAAQPIVGSYGYGVQHERSGRWARRSRADKLASAVREPPAQPGPPEVRRASHGR